MERLGFARSRGFWVRFGWGILLGLLSALGAYIFVAIMDFGINLLWTEPPDAAFLSGAWQIVVIMTVAGFVVGLLYRFTNAREINSIMAMVKGDMDTRPVPAALLVSLISLVSGFSLGPEVPAGMIAAGLSTWVSKWRNLSDEIRKSNIVSGVVAAYSGVFTSPLAILMIPVELPHMQSVAYYGTLIIAAAAAVIGFVVFFAGEGFEFSGMLRLLDLPDYEFEVWHIAVGVVLGAIGALLTLIYGLTTKGLKRLVQPLNRMPIVRSTLGGLLLGLLGMALPLTLFLGSGGLVLVTENAAQLGVTLLIIYVIRKNTGDCRGASSRVHRWPHLSHVLHRRHGRYRRAPSHSSNPTRLVSEHHDGGCACRASADPDHPWFIDHADRRSLHHRCHPHIRGCSGRVPDRARFGLDERRSP